MSLRIELCCRRVFGWSGPYAVERTAVRASVTFAARAVKLRTTAGAKRR
jgi:hypothetical protein